MIQAFANQCRVVFDTIKRYGFFFVFRVAVGVVCNEIYLLFFPLLFQKRYDRMLTRIFENSRRVFFWKQLFGWNVPLFQRPQHIARCLARKGNTVFYYVFPKTDPGVFGLKEVEPNLYLVNAKNKALIEILSRKLKEHQYPCYFQVYSTDGDFSKRSLQQHEEDGYSILYEYIDDISPSLSVTEAIPPNVLGKYEYVLADDHIPVVVTAQLLYEDVVSKRGTENLVLSCNGVDLDFFQNLNDTVELKREFQQALNQYATIVGYYGALASWFDYRLLLETARQNPTVCFVLIGIKYDASFDMAGLSEQKNILYLGPVPYKILPYYARHFTLCTIPFVINEVTNATSPLKLFEYMALGKPIITTDMLECRNYASVRIVTDARDFTQAIVEMAEYTPENKREYFVALRKECAENAWQQKAELILNMLEHYEAMRA